jgi:hypothetical protein
MALFLILPFIWFVQVTGAIFMNYDSPPQWVSTKTFLEAGPGFPKVEFPESCQEWIFVKWATLNSSRQFLILVRTHAAPYPTLYSIYTTVSGDVTGRTWESRLTRLRTGICHAIPHQRINGGCYMGEIVSEISRWKLLFFWPAVSALSLASWSRC